LPNSRRSILMLRISHRARLISNAHWSARA
jgi:hypothetical protein